MATVKLTNVKKIYDKKVVAVQEFNLDIADKEFVVFVGPSGCGKSTTLRMIAGLEDISEGTVEIDGVVVNDKQPKDRDIAMVFQNYALYPNLTVFENMAFPLRIKKMNRDEIYKRVTQTAEILGITEYLTRKPKALSGGQRQRVAIGRAMVRDSKVFLMDEPLSNLDAKLRNQMRAEIILLRKKIDTTFIYVTHDQTEAMTLGDRIVIMKDGFIQQVGTPSEVFDKPHNLFVAEFIGAPKMNITAAKLVRDGKNYVVEAYGTKIALDKAMCAKLAEKDVQSCDIKLGVRPEHIVLTNKANASAICCTVQVNEMMGSELHLHVVTEANEQVIIRVPTIDLTEEQRKALVYGTKIYITFEGRVTHLFDQNTQINLIYGDPERKVPVDDTKVVEEVDPDEPDLNDPRTATRASVMQAVGSNETLAIAQSPTNNEAFITEKAVVKDVEAAKPTETEKTVPPVLAEKPVATKKTVSKPATAAKKPATAAKKPTTAAKKPATAAKKPAATPKKTDKK